MEVETLCKIFVSPVRKPSRRHLTEWSRRKIKRLFKIFIMKALILKLKGALPSEPL